MIKKCLQCSKEFESKTGRKKYCEDCKLHRKRQSAIEYAHKKRGIDIVRKPKKRKKLVNDVKKATSSGMSYGEYIAKRSEGLIR